MFRDKVMVMVVLENKVRARVMVRPEKVFRLKFGLNLGSI